VKNGEPATDLYGFNNQERGFNHWMALGVNKTIEFNQAVTLFRWHGGHAGFPAGLPFEDPRVLLGNHLWHGDHPGDPLICLSCFNMTKISLQ